MFIYKYTHLPAPSPYSLLSFFPTNHSNRSYVEVTEDILHFQRERASFSRHPLYYNKIKYYLPAPVVFSNAVLN